MAPLILWLDLNSSYAHSSVALPALHSAFYRTPGHKSMEWCKVSATINEDMGGVVNRIYELHPDIIAATCWLFTHERLAGILSRVKSLLPSVTIILGGPEFLGDNEDFLRKNSYVDCVLRGEGEDAFPVWADVWDTVSGWDAVEGLCYIDPEGCYHDNGKARMKDFETGPGPMDSVWFNWDKPFVQLETTRGCFNTCEFCVSGGDRPVRMLPLEKVEELLGLIRSRGVKDVRVLDRTFNFDDDRACAMLDIFCRFYPSMRFHLEIHPALLTARLREKLFSLPAGMLHLEAGIQSLDDSVLSACGRRGRLSASLDGLKYLASLSNVEVHADLIAGLPEYTLQGIMSDVRTLASIYVDEIQLESLKVLPGTAMRLHAKEKGLRYSPAPPYEVLATDWMSPSDMTFSMRLSRMVDGYYNASVWKNIFRRMILELPSFLNDFLEYLIGRDVIDRPLSLENRGILLYDFCMEYCREYSIEVTLAWIEAGMSLKKKPAAGARRTHRTDDGWNVLKGNYKESLRLFYLPVCDDRGYWFGYESEHQELKPVFIAKNF